MCVQRCILSVHVAPPSFIDQLPSVHGALQNSTDVSLSCRVECEPACVIEWLRAGESIDYSPQFSIQSTPHPEEPAENRFASVVSTLKFDMTQWPGGVLDRNLDNTTFTCRSSGNLVGRAVSSTTHFEVECELSNHCCFASAPLQCLSLTSLRYLLSHCCH